MIFPTVSFSPNIIIDTASVTIGLRLTIAVTTPISFVFLSMDPNISAPLICSAVQMTANVIDSFVISRMDCSPLLSTYTQTGMVAA